MSKLTTSGIRDPHARRLNFAIASLHHLGAHQRKAGDDQSMTTSSLNCTSSIACGAPRGPALAIMKRALCCARVLRSA